MVRCEVCLLYSICDDKKHCSLSDYAKKRIDDDIAKIIAMNEIEKLSKIPLNDDFFKANGFVNHGGEWCKRWEENGHFYSISYAGDIIEIHDGALGGRFRMTNLSELETISKLLNIKIKKEVDNGK